MASEIRVNKINNRAGLGTVTYTDTGIVVSGISTSDNFKTGTSNLHSTGLNVFDLDVDGHTNLDNVSIAGVTTAAGNITIQNTQPTLIFDDTNHQDFTIAAVGNALNITDANNGNRLLFNANGSNSLYGFLSITGNLAATGTYYVSDEIQHSSDSDTKIRFPAADTFSVETAGSERLRIQSDC